MREPPLRRLFDLVLRAAVSVFAPSPSPPHGVPADQLLTGLLLGMLHGGRHRHRLTTQVTRDHMALHRHARMYPALSYYSSGPPTLLTWWISGARSRGALVSAGSTHQGSTKGRRFPCGNGGVGADRRAWTIRSLECAGSMTSSISKWAATLIALPCS